MDVSYLLRSSFLLLLVVPASSQIYTRTVLVGSLNLGGYAELRCHVDMKSKYVIQYVMIKSSDIEVSLNFSTEPSYTQWRPLNWNIKIAPERRNRIRFLPMFPGIYMLINPAHCEDEQLYTCMCVYRDIGSNVFKRVSSIVSILLEVPPHSVNVTYENPGPAIDGYRTFTAVCSGSLGKYGHAIIDWALFQNRFLTTINNNDIRIEELKYVNSTPQTGKCVRNVQQTFSVQITRLDYFISISCFLRYNDTPRLKTLRFCWDTNLAYCGRADKDLSSANGGIGDSHNSRQKSQIAETDGEMPISTIMVVVGLTGIIIGSIFGAALTTTYYDREEKQNYNYVKKT